MELNLERPLIFFDIESTGLNIASDGIIELSFVKVFPDGKDQVKTWKIKPWDYQGRKQLPIAPSASEVNGVHDEDLRDCRRFIEVAEEIALWLKDSDLAGFNSAKFDLPMLAEEFERVREYCRHRLSDSHVPAESKDKARAMLAATELDLHECRMIDVQTIYHYMEPRNLRAAYRFYCGGRDFDDAHTAEADAVATYEVLKAQLDRYREADEGHETVLKNEVKFLSELGNRARPVDYAGRIVLKDNVPMINFGKYKGLSVREVYYKDRGYFKWIAGGEFTLDTKSRFRKLEEEYRREEEEEKKRRPASEAQLLDLQSKFNGR